MKSEKVGRLKPPHFRRPCIEVVEHTPDKNFSRIIFTQKFPNHCIHMYPIDVQHLYIHTIVQPNFPTVYDMHV